MKNRFRRISSGSEGMPRLKLKLCQHENVRSNPRTYMVAGTCDSSTKEVEMSRCLGLTVQPALPTWKAETSEKLCLCKPGGQCQRNSGKVFSGLHTYFTQMYPNMHAYEHTYIKGNSVRSMVERRQHLTDFPVRPRHWDLLEEQTHTPKSGLDLKRFCTVTILSWITL